jgi:Arc/MetJ family transcription regulator
LLVRAQAALGTTGLKDTVDAALRAAVQQSARTRLAERIASGAGIDRSEALLAQTRPER